MQNLRDRKKADTRDAIRAAAVELICDRGFHGTTMEAVAEAADVSVRTVFRYFPNKEALVFDDIEENLVDIQALLESRPADEPLMDGVRAVAEVLAPRMEMGQGIDLHLAAHLRDEPALRRRYLEVLDRIEETVAAWARQRLGSKPGDLRPGLLAACMVSVQRVVVDAVTAGDPRPLPDLVREAIDLIGSGFDEAT